MFKESAPPPTTSSAEDAGLARSWLCPHQNGFLILSDDADLTDATSSHHLLFHGNTFSFNEPQKKHRKQYQTNLLRGKDLLSKLRLNQLESHRYPPLRRHSDMVLFPIDLDDTKHLYVHPWSSNSTQPTTAYPKIKQFVMTNCLFGGFILGVDDQGNKYPLIDHNLEVKDMITRVEIDDAAHPYESMSFAALEGLFSLMKKIGDPEFSIRYHLPVIDYMLYGLHLYIGGKIAFGALEKFIEKIKERGEKHKTIILGLAIKAGINIYVESPFNNLFSSDINLTASSLLEQLSLSGAQVNRIKREHYKFSASLGRAATRGGHKISDFRTIIDVLNTLDEFVPASTAQTLAESDSDSTISDASKSPRDLFEVLCIENILERLSSNTENTEYQQVWQTIISSDRVNRFSPLQQLFKIANVAFLARAQLGHANFEVCSLLPIDENPIAEAYKDLLSDSFGHILCLSWFPPLLNYVNHDDEITSQNQHHRNNLFRLRSDLLAINHSGIQKYLTDYFKLSYDFWSTIGRIFSDTQQSTEITQQKISNAGQLLHGSAWTIPNGTRTPSTTDFQASAPAASPTCR